MIRNSKWRSQVVFKDNQVHCISGDAYKKGHYGPYMTTADQRRLRYIKT